MTDTELKIKYNNVCKNLSNRKLKPAFDMLEKWIREIGLQMYSDEWRNLEQTYNYMLKYTLEGIKDPERQKIYRKLIVSVFELADKINEANLSKLSSSFIYGQKRAFLKNIPNLSAYLNTLEELSASDDKDAATELQEKMKTLFLYFWFQDKFNQHDTGFIYRFFASDVLPHAYKSFLVSSIILSLFRYFDEEKFSTLFDLYELEETEINQRAIVGLLVNLYKYDLRLQFYPSVTGRLKILNENPTFKLNLERIIIQFIRSKETEKIQQKIKDEIIPEMIKISPNLKDKINLDSLMDENLGEDKNPEWEKLFEDSPGLMDKMEEFSEWQMEGADVFMGSFSMLKIFPFFNEFTNWFMPFFPENPEIAKEIDETQVVNKQFIAAIDTAPILCNSDKYSFCFSIQRLPLENREFMAEGMKAEMNQFNELQKDEELTDPGKKAGYISNQFIQDLYRFFKLHPAKDSFEDIFQWRFDFHKQIALGEILKEDPKILRNIAEYYFTKNYFEEAAEIFTYLLGLEKSGELYQKLGFCFQKLGHFQTALDSYKKAELFDLNRKWNLSKIALCYRNLKQPEKALEYYREVENLDEENLNTQLNIGHCLLELEQFEEALKCYFKVEYLAPGNKKVRRPIGWCSFVTGKKEQAEKYFSLLIDDKPTKHDLMNMGHVQWSLGNRKQALEFYKKSIKQTDFSENEFFEVFDEDLPYLINQGIEKEDVPIMLDQLRYFVEE